jgi:hypothetical protein
MEYRGILYSGGWIQGLDMSNMAVYPANALIKKKIKFSSYKEIHSEAVAKSYIFGRAS